MWGKTVVFCLLIGASFAAEEQKDQETAGATNNVKRGADSYAPPPSSSGDKEPAPVYGPPSSPASYSKSIPAAAIRNVETVAVTKTITPVVTKTTTYNTHSEPALSIGHVQGYSQSATGQPKIAPVQFQTQYTSYLNPTVGVNGPVTYTGPAVVLGGGYAIPLTGLSSFNTASGTLSLSSTGSSGGGSSSSYGAPSQESAPASTYGPPGRQSGSPLGSFSMNYPQYLSFRPQAAATPAANPLSLHNIQQLQSLRAPAPLSSGGQQYAASAYSPVAVRSPIHQGVSAAVSSSPFAYMQAAIQQRPQIALAAASSPVAKYQQPLYQQHHLQHLQQPQYHHQHQPIAQPTVQYVQTYAMPSVSFTKFQPVNKLQHQQQQQLVKAVRQ